MDGFLIKQEQRHRIVKKTRTLKENSFSDHRPKELMTRTVTRQRSNKKVSINHIILYEPKRSEEYSRRTEKAMEKMVEEGKVQSWFNLSQMIIKGAANVAGGVCQRERIHHGLKGTKKRHKESTN